MQRVDLKVQRMFLPHSSIFNTVIQFEIWIKELYTIGFLKFTGSGLITMLQLSKWRPPLAN